MSYVKRFRLWLAGLFLPRGYSVMMTASTLESVLRERMGETPNVLLDGLSVTQLDKLIDRLAQRKDRLQQLSGIAGEFLSVPTRGRPDQSGLAPALQQFSIDIKELTQAIASTGKSTK